MSNARTLIIVTMEDSDIFQNFRQTYSHDEQHKDNIKVLRAANEENIFLIGRDQPDSTTTCVLSSSCNDQSETIICTHRGYINTGGLSQKVIMFSHSDETGKEILKFAKKEISFDSIWNYLEKKSYNFSISQILHFFFPLDIDMQALKTTDSKEGYLNDMDTDLQELYKLDQYNERKINEHYRRKLFSLWLLLGASLESNQIPFKAKELAPINNPSNDLLKLAGLENGNREESPIYKFLESLDERKTEAINYFLAPFESRGLKGCDGKEINSFHDWYCALASCLKGEEACK